MTKNTIVITGATSGIGYEAAIELARRGHSIIGIGSSNNSCNSAKNQSIKDLPNNNILFLSCDLSNHEEIINITSSLNAKYENINILINNAGSIFLKRIITASGFEKTFSVNYLGHFLFTRLLLSKLINSNQARIINVSSIAYKHARINNDDLVNPINYSPMKVYARSKLAQLLFTKYLGDKLKRYQVNVVAMHPGIVATKLLSRNKRWGSLLTNLLKIIGKSPKNGAQTLIYLASVPNEKLETTKYYVNEKIKQLLSHATNTDDAKNLWDMSSKLCNLPSDLQLH